MLMLEERVDRLETVFERFLINNEKTLRRMENLMSDTRRQAERDREQAERDREQIERDREQAERDREQIQQILQRMERFEQQVDQDRKEDRKEWNKRWGELANRLGTLAEDIVAPNIPRLARKQFGCSDTPDDFMIRRWIRHKTDNSKRREFDVVAVYPNKVFINETKTTPRMTYIDDFLEVVRDIHGYFPEYQGKTIVPIFAALYLPAEVVKYLTRHRIYAMGMGDETMQLLNFEEIADLRT